MKGTATQYMVTGIQPVWMPHLLSINIAIGKHEWLVVLVELLTTDMTHQTGLGAVGVREWGSQGVEGGLAHRAVRVVACRPLQQNTLVMLE